VEMGTDVRGGVRLWLGLFSALLVVAAIPSTAGASKTHHETKLVGIGATAAAMKAAHGVSYIKGGLCSAAPHCFGPVVRNKEGFGYLFTSDTFQDGILTDYSQAFATNTTIASAESQILRWLPSDAKMSAVTIDHTGGSCALITITSPTLAKLFSAHPDIQDPEGQVAVELGYIDSDLNMTYNPNNVEHADLDAAGPTVSMPNGSVQPSPYSAITPSVGC
jgi:hypothetical protein